MLPAPLPALRSSSSSREGTGLGCPGFRRNLESPVLEGRSSSPAPVPAQTHQQSPLCIPGALSKPSWSFPGEPGSASTLGGMNLSLSPTLQTNPATSCPTAPQSSPELRVGWTRLQKSHQNQLLNFNQTAQRTTKITLKFNEPGLLASPKKNITVKVWLGKGA